MNTIKDNYRHLILIGLGITVSVVALKYLVSGPSKKMTKNDLAKNLAKRFQENVSKEESSGKKHDINQLCHAIQEACLPELAKAEKEYKEALRKVQLTEFTSDVTRHYQELIEQQEKIRQQTINQLMQEKGLRPDEIDGIVREMESENMLDSLYALGKIEHPILTERKILTDILKEQAEFEQKLAEENPELRPSLIRQASSTHVSQKHGVNQQLLDKAIETHDATQDEHLAGLKARYTPQSE